MCCVVYCMCACHSWSCPSCIANTVLWLPRPMRTPAAMSMTPAWPQEGSGWLPSAAMVEEAKESSSSLWYIDGSMLDGLPLLASVRGKAKESDGRTKRQARRSRSLARARERCSVSQRERREDTQSVLVENLCVTAKLPSSLHEQTRGCRSGVGPRTTLRAAHQPGVGCRPPQGWKATPLPGCPPTYLLSKRRPVAPRLQKPELLAPPSPVESTAATHAALALT
jgi:hypothetical protein